MAPFRRALKGVLPASELEGLIETISGTGLRLNVPRADCLVVEAHR
jgi:hypothetical protein